MALSASLSQLRVLRVTVLAAALPICAVAQCLTELSPSAVAADDLFGSVLAIENEWLVVGAPHHDAVGDDAGAAWVYKRVGTTWVEHQQLLPPANPNGGHFGFGVALSGDTLVVSETLASQLAVYRLQGDVWMPSQVISTPATYLLGESVALDGDVLVAGSYNASNPGLVRVYERSGGVFNYVTTLTLVPQLSQLFGLSAAVDGNRIVVGAPRDWFNPGQAQDGALYVYDRLPSGWTLVAALGGPGFTSSAELGTSCSVSGDVVTGGAPGFEVNNTPFFGAVVVYELGLSGWQHVQTIEGQAFGDLVGSGVTVDGDTLAIAAPGVGSGPTSGVQWIFKRKPGGWVQTATLSPGGKSNGNSVALDLDGPRLAVGHPTNGDNSALVFTAVTDLDVWATVPGAVVGDWAPCLAASGSLEAGSTVTLEQLAGPPAALSFLVLGTSVLSVPFKGGMLVPSPSVILAWPLDSLGGVELGSTLPAGMPPGVSLVVQAWTPASGAPAGFVATDGLIGITP